MKCVCISDCHGQLPKVMPEGDILLMAGDMLCPGDTITQHCWVSETFNYWIASLPYKDKILVAGNHDFFLYETYPPTHLLNSSCHYLEDSGIDLHGIKIWGSPWTREYCNWAFMTTEEQLKRKWDMVPEDTDILLLHSPPYGVGDEVEIGVHKGQKIGSPSLLERMMMLGSLKLTVFGHNHAGHGMYMKNSMRCVNASLVNDKYEMAFPIIEIEV